jgi:hypothetical protein
VSKSNCVPDAVATVVPAFAAKNTYRGADPTVAMVAMGPASFWKLAMA